MRIKYFYFACFLLFSSSACYQFTHRKVRKQIEPFTKIDSCIYLRDFQVSFNSHIINNKSWKVKLRSGSIYVFQLCGGKLEKLAPDAILSLSSADSSEINSPIQEIPIGSSFVFKCNETVDYNVNIRIKEHVKYGRAIAVLYFKGKF